MSANLKNINIEEYVDKELEETVEIAKNLAITLEKQGESINNSHRNIKEINENSQNSLTTVKMMNSSLYRWWIWLVNLGRQTTNTIHNLFPKSNNDDQSTILTIKDSIDPYEQNQNPETLGSLSSHISHNTCIIDNKTNNIEKHIPVPKNLSLLKELSLNIDHNLSRQCQQYDDITQLTEQNNDRFKTISKIIKKI